jgi:DNA-binding NarL/FixJ family response regulator
VALTVTIADDHSLVRQGLRRYLETADGIEIVGEAATGREAIALAQRTKPDVALVDIRMPDVDGIQATKAISEAVPETRVVILTAYDDRQFVIEAVRAGARGYVLKSREAEQLIQAIRLVAEGNMVIDPEVVVAVADELSDEKRRERATDRLSARELEILQLLAFGYTNRDIGKKLFISPDTVKTHLEHIFQKLGQNDRTAAVAEALRRRIIE